MKRINSFAAAAVAMLAAVSCAKELPQNEVPAGEAVVYTATTDGGVTKATLGVSENNKPQSHWEADDAITIHNGTKAFEFTTAESGAKVNFSYTGEDFSAADGVIAVYPAGDNVVADINAKTVTAHIPTYQSSRENTYNHDAAVAVAYSQNNTLAFKNATALLKFTVKTDNIKGLIFYGLNGEALTGNMLVTLNEDNTVKSVEGQLTELEGQEQLGTWAKLWAQTDNWCFNVGSTYYLAVAPNNFSKGFGIKLEVEGKEVEVGTYKTEGYELRPNTILDLGEFEYVAPELPATVETVYLNPGVWNSDNAWYAAFFFEGSNNMSVVMEDANADGIFEAAVPEGFTNVIFCRMNPEYSEFGWNVTENDQIIENHVWNQTADLSVPLAGDDKVCHVIASWDASEWKTLADATVPEEPVDKGTGWSLPGGYNNWNTAAVYLYEEGDYYVAKNVMLMDTKEGTDSGFKFCYAENNTWLGFTSKDPVAVDTWYSLGGNANINLAQNVAYDVYATKELDQFYITLAGGDVPLAPGEIRKYNYTVYVDDHTGWADMCMYMHGNINDLGGSWPGIKQSAPQTINGVTYKVFEFEAEAGLEEKIILNNNNKGKQLSDYPITLTSTITEFYLYANSYGIVAVDPNNRAADPMYPGPQTIEIYCATDYTHLWAWLPNSGDLNLTGGTWPGMEGEDIEETVDGVTYTKKWVLENVASTNMNGYNLGVVFSGGGSQTPTSSEGPYYLTNKMYFVVDSGNNIIHKN